ncbi:MAG: hypothetical protein ACI837_002215 [Crocinitomicaceae bacterium]|jgi:hypothetical protein
MIRKQLLNILIFLSLGIANCFGQGDDLSIDNDRILLRIQEHLPDGWKMYFQSKSLLIIKETPIVGVLVKNEVTEPTEVEFANAAEPWPDTTIMDKISFTLPNAGAKEIWGTRKEALNSNKKIAKQIENLPEMMNIKKRNGKGIGTMLDFPSEKVEMEYEAKLSVLQSQIVRIPYYYSEHYCFYSFSVDQLRGVYEWSPNGIESEVEEIESVLEKYLNH